MQYICLHDLIYHLQTGRYSAGDDTDSSGGDKQQKFDPNWLQVTSGQVKTKVRAFGEISLKFYPTYF